MGCKVLDYEIVENIGLLLESNIIIYGTSGRAEHLYSLIEGAGLNIVACCDGAADREGKQFHQWQIESFASAAEKIDIKKTIILICSTFVKEIIADCSRVCSQELRFVTSFGFKIAILLNRNDTRLPLDFRELYNEKYSIWLKLGRKLQMAKIQWDYNNKLIQFMKTDPILVYQMGKVGSAGIYHSLQAAGIETVHLHYFQPWNNSIPENEYKEYQDLLHQIISKKDKIKIITLVRDPLVRDISAFFQQMPNPADKMYQEFSGSLMDSVLEILYTWISSKNSFLGNSGLHIDIEKKALTENKVSVFSWFDMELKEVFDIDIYQYPFDRDKGYSVICKDNIECLVLKLEKLDSCHDIIRKFIGRKDLLIQSDNIGSEKEYGYLYREIKENIIIPSIITISESATFIQSRRLIVL